MTIDRTKYRVDLTSRDRVPCGMSTIRYIGGSLISAHRVFGATDPTNKEGVILSQWDASERDYVILSHKERLLTPDGMNQ